MKRLAKPLPFGLPPGGGGSGGRAGAAVVVEAALGEETLAAFTLLPPPPLETPEAVGNETDRRARPSLLPSPGCSTLSL